MTGRNWIRIIAVVTVGIVGLAACSGSDDDDTAGSEGVSGAETIPETSEDTSPPAEETGGPVIENFAFSNMTVPSGEVVTVANQDGVPHTLTTDDGSFDTGQIEAGGRQDVTTPGTAGNYPVHCEVHPSMKGELAVT